ncbi:ABC transporter ATP-binding protein [Angelakisella massiliensis]|uniref:ABC transporter ATP-binding protein n=1 Tax=Angelakisella massiliensis TaxID=1871018 RepID=UPI0008F8F4B5|nr:ABC transporter ATP-binding protein [Angelakisella massiliensis]
MEEKKEVPPAGGGEERPVIIELKDVCKSFEDTRVVRHMNLQVREGEFLTLLGPSGCGKTTTLRMIAGFEQPTSGQLLIEGQDMKGKAPYERNVNTVFQNYALFPHMTVFDNIAFGLVEKKVSKKEIRARVEEMLRLVQLQGFGDRMPSQLSGGQKQRVAIARALVNNPKVLLLDEPLGALDLKLRKQMQTELKHLQKSLGITFIYVTHDQEEALTMSDRIAVMNEGVLEQADIPSRIYEHPVSKFVAEFIGETNIIEAYLDAVDGDCLHATMECGHATIYAPGFVLEEMVYLSVRPENLKCSLTPVPGFAVRGIVREHIYVGNLIKTIIELPTGQMLRMLSLPFTPLAQLGQLVYVYWDKDKAVLMHTKEEKLYNLIESGMLGKEEAL